MGPGNREKVMMQKFSGCYAGSEEDQEQVHVRIPLAALARKVLRRQERR